MPAMPDIFEEVARDLGHEWDTAADAMRRLMYPRHHDAPQPAAATPVPHNETQDPQEAPPMSFLLELENDAKALAAKFESVDHEALNVLDAVQSNPATAEAYVILSQLTHLPTAALAVPLSMLRGALQALGGMQPQSVASDAVPAPQPAGPVVAGQA